MYIFPLHRFAPEAIKADVVAKVVSGGTALNDEEDVIQTDGGGRWEIGFSGISLRTVWRERAWSAWTSYLAGGARRVLVPVYALRTAPRPVSGSGLLRPSNVVADDDVFPTSLAFAAPYIVAQCVGPVAVRATTLSIAVAQGARVQPGMRFGAGVRAYKIEQVISRDGLSATVKISPPARAAIAAGDPLNFNWPLVQCRAVTGQDLAADMMWGRQGTTSLAFVEDFSDAG